LAKQTYQLASGVDDKYLTEIGRIVVAWGLLETWIDQAIFKILGLHSGASAAITIGIGVQFRLEMLVGLATTSIHGKRNRETLLAIIKAIRAVETERNFVVHAMWMGQGETITGYIGKKNVPGHRLETWGVDKFKAIGEKITDVTSRLLTFTLDETVKRRRGLWRETLSELPPKNPGKSPRARKSAKLPRPPASPRE
jgi:hypothetical protein